jgi:hypothetical protein
MAIEKLSSAQALAFRKNNAQSIWPKPERGAERLLPIPLPSVSPKLKIREDDKIFCIGSCFAREIEKTLKQLGLCVSSSEIEMPQDKELHFSLNAFLNKYTVHSILSELTLALEPEVIEPSRCLIEVSDGLFQDYQLAGNRLSASFDEMLSYRANFSRGFSCIRDANVVIITLGLSEIWYDKACDLYLNKAPDPKVLRRHPNRFELRVLDYQETLDGLEEIYTLLSKHMNSGFKVFITVSPVPLLSTFREIDIFEANAYSKAVLRAATEAFVNRYENVGYFPSYEMVTMGPQDVVWGGRGDFRHVNRDYVEVIMLHALEAFLECPREDLAIRKVESMARVLIDAGKPHDALTVLNRLDGTARAELNHMRKRAERLLEGKEEWRRSHTSIHRYVEKWLASKLLKDRYLQKYTVARSAFLADSRFSLLRWWGRITR